MVNHLGALYYALVYMCTNQWNWKHIWESFNPSLFILVFYPSILWKAVEVENKLTVTLCKARCTGMEN